MDQQQTIRVVKVATPEEQFHKLRGLLEKKGSLVAKKDETEGNTHKLSFGFAFRNRLPAYLPYTDYADFTIEYDSRVNDWACYGDVFGSHVKLDHPKLFFTNVRDVAQNKQHSVMQFLLRCEKFWERYNGDIPQFAYKMGVELSNVGTMTVMPGEEMTQAHWHQDLDTPFDVWFSKHVMRNHVKPKYMFGFHEDVRLHRFELSHLGIRTLIDSINHHVWWVRSFCDPLIDAF